MQDLETKTNHSMLLVHLSKVLDENPEEICAIYQISPNTPRSRALRDDFQIEQLFQRVNPKSKEFQKGEVYRGDRELKSDDQITIQIHDLELLHNGISKGKYVPVIAIWIPDRLFTSVVYQP